LSTLLLTPEGWESELA